MDPVNSCASMYKLTPITGVLMSILVTIIPVTEFYQTEHLLTGRMGDPSGQLKVSENSAKLETVPTTRNCAGLCEPT